MGVDLPVTVARKGSMVGYGVDPRYLGTLGLVEVDLDDSASPLNGEGQLG